MSRSKTVLAAAAGLTAGVVLGGAPWAEAGHLNRVIEADLDGRSEVANGARNNRIVGDPNGEGEIYVFGIDGDPNTLCYVLIVGDIADLDQLPGNGRAAHIHEGAPGTNGPVVANLAFPTDGQAADCLTNGEAGKFANGGNVADILAHPEDYYVNVHNTEYPNGAIRGQLEGQDGH